MWSWIFGRDRIAYPSKQLWFSFCTKILWLWLLLSSYKIATCMDEENENKISFLEPRSSTVWIAGVSSYHIEWEQTGFAFQWDLELLNGEKRKERQIAEAVSEFSESTMSFLWLLSEELKPGVYHIRVSERGSTANFAISEPFTVRKEGRGSTDLFIIPGMVY